MLSSKLQKTNIVNYAYKIVDNEVRVCFLPERDLTTTHLYTHLTKLGFTVLERYTPDTAWLIVLEDTNELSTL